VLQHGQSAALQQNPAAQYLTDFDPPRSTIWKQQEKTGGSGHNGNRYGPRSP
jgi:hypothetical protein